MKKLALFVTLLALIASSAMALPNIGQFKPVPTKILFPPVFTINPLAASVVYQ